MCSHIPSSSSKGYSSPSFAQPFPAEPLLVFSLFHREYMCVVSGITTLQAVSIHFSQEEWEHLDSAQMNLWKEVMLENFSHLVSVGKDIYPLKIRLCPWESLPSPLKIIKLTSWISAEWNGIGSFIFSIFFSVMASFPWLPRVWIWFLGHPQNNHVSCLFCEPDFPILNQLWSPYWNKGKNSGWLTESWAEVSIQVSKGWHVHKLSSGTNTFLCFQNNYSVYNLKHMPHF